MIPFDPPENIRKTLVYCFQVDRNIGGEDDKALISLLIRSFKWRGPNSQNKQ